METVTILRERMRAKGVPVMKLAKEARMYPNDLYLILGGSPCGAARRARITEAARRLGLTDEDA